MNEEMELNMLLADVDKALMLHGATNKQVLMAGEQLLLSGFGSLCDGHTSREQLLLLADELAERVRSRLRERVGGEELGS